MLYNGSIVLDSLFDVLLMGYVPFMNISVWNRLQLRNPFLYVQTVLIVVFLLSPWVEYPKVWLSISPIPYTPLPSSWVLHWRVVCQLVCKILFSQSPVQKQVLWEKTCCYHSASVVHIPSCIHLSHRRIYNRISSFPLLPCAQMLLVYFPLYLIKLWLKTLSVSLIIFQHPWMVMSYVHVKISPMKLTYQVVFKPKFCQNCVINFPNRHGSEMKICAQASITTNRKVAIIIVVFKLLDWLKNFKSIISATMHLHLLILLIKFLTLLNWYIKFNFFVLFYLLKDEFIKLIGFGYF